MVMYEDTKVESERGSMGTPKRMTKKTDVGVITSNIPQLMERKGQMRIQEEHAEGNHSYSWNTSVAADEMGVDWATMNRWLTDKADRIDKTSMARLCFFLNCTPGDMFTWEAPRGYIQKYGENYDD